MMNLGKLDSTVLLFGGPYSNLAATSAMRARARQLGIGPEHIICTGDLVAYCAEPRQTLELIRDWGISVVMGNCEEALAFDEDDCGCGFEPDSSCSVLAITWYEYASRYVNQAQRLWLRELPPAIDFELGDSRFRVIHGSLHSINEFVFASSDRAAKQHQLEQAEVDVIVGGHCGLPFGQRLEAGFWLNAGVIGMPANDGSPGVWYMLLDPVETGVEVSWHRLEYDYGQSHRSTRAAGMVEYGQALRDGFWPNMDILPPPEREQRGRPLELPSLKI